MDRNTGIPPEVPAAPRPRPDLTEVVRVFHKYRPMLLALPGVKGVGYGLKSVGGRLEDGPGRHCVIVYVERKIPERAGAYARFTRRRGGRRELFNIPVPWWVEEQVGMIPTDLDGVPTDIREAPQVVATDPAAASPPGPVALAVGSGVQEVVGGMSVRLNRADGGVAGTGTIGLVAERNADGAVVFVSCSHVLFGAAPQLDPDKPGHTLTMDDGQVVASPLVNALPANGLDAAIALLAAGIASRTRAVMGFNNIRRTVDRNTAPERVFKIGRNGRTEGQITARMVTTPINFDRLGTRSLTHLIEIAGDGTDFADGGDSGSVVLGFDEDQQLVAVGLIVGIAMSDGQLRAYAHPLRAIGGGAIDTPGVFDQLDLVLG